MAEKTQKIVSGGLNKIIVSTDEGATVTISKDDVSRSIVAVNNLAEFNGVSKGVWSVLSASGGASYSTVVEVTDEFLVNAPLAVKANTLNIGEKIKINGVGFTIINKNLGGIYGSDSLTLISDTVVGNSAFTETNYKTSNVKTMANDLYNTATDNEKACMIAVNRIVLYQQSGGGAIASNVGDEYTYVPCNKELGGDYLISYETNTVNLGFDDNASRAFSQDYWMASRLTFGSISGDNKEYWYVASGGGIVRGSSGSSALGVRVVTNIYGQANVTGSVDSSGYHALLSM